MVKDTSHSHWIWKVYWFNSIQFKNFI